MRWLGWATAILVICGAARAPAWADEPAALRATLPNGLRVVIVPDRLAPVASVALNYLAGSNDAPDGFPGTAHALEHMMFRGSAGLDREQLSELSARLGGDANANTTETVTQYTATVPAADLGLVLRAEALRMRGLTLAQADWEQERGAIEQEVARDLSSPFYNFAVQAQSILFAGTPYEHDALGSRETFERTDAALLRGFYERWYAPNNAILVIAGDVDPAATLALAQDAFGPIPRRDIPAHAPIAPRPAVKSELTLPTNFPFGLAALAYRMPGLKSGDFAAADILGDVLGSQRGALYGLVPAGRALIAAFQYQAKPDVGFGLALAGFPNGSDPAPVLADLRRVLAEAAAGDIPAELVEAAKRREIAQLAFGYDSIDGLARAWSRALAQQGAESPDDLARAYGAVTLEDVRRVAREVLDPEHAVTATLTPRDAAAPAPAGGGFGGTESFAAPPDHPVTLPDWAASALATPRLPAPGEPPAIATLANGLRLIVQPEHVGHTVSVFGRVREVTETQEPPGQEGVAQVTADLFSYGTTAHDRLAFRKAADDLAAELRTGARFSLRVLAPDFEAGMRLLAEGQLQPAFPDGGFAVVRAQVAKAVAGQSQTPDYRFERATQAAIVPPGDPTLREATAEGVAALRVEDVRAYHARAFRPDLTTLVVIGDITAERARAVVEQTFGGWQAQGPTPAIDLPPVGPSVASRMRIPDPGSQQDSVALVESLAIPIQHPDRYPLLLGDLILGNGPASRLYRDLRTRSGYVYSVDSDIDWSRTRADYTISFGADPANVPKARELALRDLAEMRAQPVGEAELMRAQAGLLRALAMRGASVGAIAGRFLHAAELDLPLLPAEVTAQRFLAVTAEDIRRAFATWLRPDDLAMVVKGPAE